MWKEETEVVVTVTGEGAEEDSTEFAVGGVSEAVVEVLRLRE